MTTVPSREFNRDVSAAKRAAQAGPVTITALGRRAHVLLTAADYDRLANAGGLVGTRLRMEGADSIDLPVPKRTVQPSPRIPEL
ncbi:MAG: type II toxin-antitoxin system prevent-host-death family antitoxin [Bifidobacteriaceae bacterium]|jgi:prevent-host-death family protein|nr:type II toxin-antitoxin system prevent-host-death family antitoxin [Bifidobacteriaceae bacterium]